MRDRDKPKAILLDELSELRRQMNEAQEWEVEKGWSRDLIRLLFTMAPAGICLVQQGRVVLANRMFEAITGYAEDELVGEDPLSLFIPQDRGAFQGWITEAVSGELPTPHRFRLRYKADGTRSVIGAVCASRCRGEPAAMEYFLDVTNGNLGMARIAGRC